MTPVRLGAVGYLNARPLVYGLEKSARFDLRFDVPSTCARLLHAHEIDVGLIPSIECLRGTRPYAIVPGLAIATRGSSSRTSARTPAMTAPGSALARRTRVCPSPGELDCSHGT